MLHLFTSAAILLSGSSPSTDDNSKIFYALPNSHPDNNPIIPPSNEAPLERELRRATYKGSNYRVSADINPNTCKTETINLISAMLQHVDYVSNQRVDYFNWCNRRDLTIVGWIGTITEIKAVRTGWLVNLKVSPKLVQAGNGQVATADFIGETYLFDKSFKFMHVDTYKINGAQQGTIIGH